MAFDKLLHLLHLSSQIIYFSYSTLLAYFHLADVASFEHLLHVCLKLLYIRDDVLRAQQLKLHLFLKHHRILLLNILFIF